MMQFKYRFLALLRNKGQIFWTLMFPLILGTFFYIAFGSIVSTTESFSKIPVAVVGQGESESYFTDVLETLSKGEEALLVPQYTSMEDAEKLLDSGEVKGIFTVGADIRLIVSENGLNQSILKTISDSYLQVSGTLSTISQTRPEKTEAVLAAISKDIQINEEISFGKGETDTSVQYFYALIAMVCLFGSFFGGLNVFGIQANRSSLAARRCVAPAKKISVVISDFGAAVVLMFLILLIVLAYLVFVLGINFGEEWGFVILTGFIGCIAGVSYGTFIAAALKTGERTTEGILTGSSLFLCFLSGLMFGNMKYIIEQYAPVINRINPAALLSDAFYSLAIYDTYSRYTGNMINMLIISAIFCIGSALILRRKRYANI